MYVLVTGVSGGIGKEVARYLSERGMYVFGTVRDIHRRDSADSQAMELPLDLLSDESIHRLPQLINRPLDILINNAGIAGTRSGSRMEAPFYELSREEYLNILEVNVIGAFLVTRALLPLLRQGRRKLIVNVGSELASIGSNATGGRYAYRCSKAGLNMLTKCLAVDLQTEGFTCVVYEPGWVKTTMGGAAAPIEPQEAAKLLVDFVLGADSFVNGKFFGAGGRELSW